MLTRAKHGYQLYVDDGGSKDESTRACNHDPINRADGVGPHFCFWLLATPRPALKDRVRSALLVSTERGYDELISQKTAEIYSVPFVTSDFRAYGACVHDILCHFNNTQIINTALNSCRDVHSDIDGTSLMYPHSSCGALRPRGPVGLVNDCWAALLGVWRATVGEHASSDILFLSNFTKVACSA